MAIAVPAGPAVAQSKLHAHRIEPPQPGPQQWRRLERFWENPPAGADEGRLPQRLTPRAQGVWWKRRDRGSELLRRFAITGDERRQRLAVCQIEPATPRHQEL